MTEKKKRIFLNICRILMIVLVLFVTGWIFSNSLENGAQSSNKSEAVTEWIEEIVNDVAEAVSDEPLPERIVLDRFVIRKLAHFSEYALLGFLSVGTVLLFVKRWFFALFTEIYGITIALIDEGIQRFVDGRAGSFLDSGIDFAGFTFGLLLLFGGFLFVSHRIKKRREKLLTKNEEMV